MSEKRTELQDMESQKRVILEEAGYPAAWSIKSGRQGFLYFR